MKNWQCLPGKPLAEQLHWGLTVNLPAAVIGIASNLFTILTLGTFMAGWELDFLGWRLNTLSRKKKK
jgi:hypothetical protein